MKNRKPGSLCLGPHFCARMAIKNRNPLCLGYSQRRQRRSHMVLAYLMHLLDSRHLSIVKKIQGWSSAKHLVGMSLQIPFRTGRQINYSPHVSYDCADTFLLLFSPQFIVLLLLHFPYGNFTVLFWQSFLGIFCWLGCIFLYYRLSDSVLWCVITQSTCQVKLQTQQREDQGILVELFKQEDILVFCQAEVSQHCEVATNSIQQLRMNQTCHC